ncbi:MAG: hypothetical protein NT023_02305 [Armatimonadetes bacterium]|nr:hypothetical protein [Armatimonadota bacterium]
MQGGFAPILFSWAGEEPSWFEIGKPVRVVPSGGIVCIFSRISRFIPKRVNSYQLW